MKLVLIIGDAAVGKMTVGQELMKITDLRLFHNHMAIEPVLDIYCAELVAPQEIRLKRNATENRLKNKPSKRDIETSNQRLIKDDKNYRLVSRDGEIPFKNYIKIDNSDITAKEAALIIKNKFNL